MCVLVPWHRPRSSNLLSHSSSFLCNVTCLQEYTESTTSTDYLLTFCTTTKRSWIAPWAHNPRTLYLLLYLFLLLRYEWNLLSLILPCGLSRWIAMTTSRNSLRLMTPSPSASYSVKTLLVREEKKKDKIWWQRRYQVESNRFPSPFTIVICPAPIHVTAPTLPAPNPFIFTK